VFTAASSKAPPPLQPSDFTPSLVTAGYLEVLYKGSPRHVSVQHFTGETLRTFAEHTATTVGVVVVVVCGGGGGGGGGGV